MVHNQPVLCTPGWFEPTNVLMRMRPANLLQVVQVVHGKAWQLPLQCLRFQEDEHPVKGERIYVHVHGWRCVTAVTNSLR